MFLSLLGLQYISHNKLSSQKQASAALTCINVSATTALLTTLHSFLDFHIIGQEILFSLTRQIINPPCDPSSLRFSNDEPL